MEPTRQRYLNISFALDDGSGGLGFLTLPVKPEELTRQEPSRTNVVNSLDGAWVDSFGRGLATLTISGNTGWRDRQGQGDGIAQFQILRDDFVHRWHRLRSEKIAAGLDPSEVRLIFIDPLNGSYVADVVPSNFSLRRSKSQPLLLMYAITMTVVADEAFNPYPELQQEIKPDPVAAEQSLDGSIAALDDIQKSLASKTAEIGEMGKAARDWTTKTFGPALGAARSVIATARATKTLISTAGQQVVNLAADLSAIGTTLWGAVAEVTSIPLAIKSEVLRAKSAISNVRCVLVNGYSKAYASYNYSDIYGASNCSSTAGGRPASAYAGGNTFESGGVQAAAPLVVIGAKAGAALIAGLSVDPIAPPSNSALSSIAEDMNEGITWQA